MLSVEAPLLWSLHKLHKGLFAMESPLGSTDVCCGPSLNTSLLHLLLPSPGCSSLRLRRASGTYMSVSQTEFSLQTLLFNNAKFLEDFETR